MQDLSNIVTQLKPKLKDYLRIKLGSQVDDNTFKCFAHDEATPSMKFNPQSDNTTVHCFGCGANHDIFSAASLLENLPSAGREWITVTIPTLASHFDLSFDLGELDPGSKERLSLKKFWSDVENFFDASEDSETLIDFVAERNISINHLKFLNCDFQDFLKHMVDLGYDKRYVYEHISVGDVESKAFPLIGKSLISILIKDKYRQPIGIVARNLDGLPKYINSPDSLLYKKGEVLLGLDVALRSSRDILYIVEGPGDLAALHLAGITCAVALCGTALSKAQINAIKLSGFKSVSLCLDWDRAGQEAIRKHLEEHLENFVGLQIDIVEQIEDFKDLGEYIQTLTEETQLQAVSKELKAKRIHSFNWLMNLLQDMAPETLVKEMLKYIVVEPTASKREALSILLSERTKISTASIIEDADYLRKNKDAEKDKKVQLAVQHYIERVKENPSNAPILLAQHQEELQGIDAEYKKNELGVSYQLARLQALEEQIAVDDETTTKFLMKKLYNLSEALDNGMPWSQGTLMYVGGRPNSGKTAFVWEVALDVLINDPDAIIIVHATDDTYFQLLPRIKTGLANHLAQPDDNILTIGMASSPTTRLHTSADRYVYELASKALRKFIADGKLYILDNEDGPYLSVLERQLKYIRAVDKTSKILIIQDNTHNLMDFGDLDQNQKMTSISNSQVSILARYKASMFATVELRKGLPMPNNEIKWPTDDDIADARSLGYRPKAILHVYNDLNDRREKATIFHTQKGKMMPRNIVYFGKNKITSFKDKLAYNLYPATVTLEPINIDEAREEEQAVMEQRKEEKKSGNYN